MRRDHLLNLDVKDPDQWQKQTYYLICLCQLIFSTGIFLLYGIGKPLPYLSNALGISQFAVWAFPVISVARLAYVHYGKPNRSFAWLSACIDTILLTVIIFTASIYYGTPAASLRAPTFVFYFVIVAIYALQFEVKLVLSTGFMGIPIWVGIILIFALGGADFTKDYETYLSSTSLLLGAEIEKLVGLFVFTIILAMAVKRGSDLLESTAEQRLTEVKLAEIEKTAQMKSDFIAIMSHEMRTPMNGVLGMAQVLRATNLDKDQNEYVETIASSGDALLVIINNILDFSKLAAGKLELVNQPFSLHALCDAVIEKQQSSAKEKSLTLHHVPQSPSDGELIGDSRRLEQVLTHLVGNAIKFTETGSVKLHSKMEVLEENVSVTLEIHDTGIGIAKDDQDHIFDEFVQIDSTISRKYGGTGIGLSMSKSLLELMGTEISVRSVEGQGSVFSFTVRLPSASKPEKAITAPNTVLTDSAASPVSRTRALLLTPNHLALGKSGETITQVHTASEAAEHLIHALRTRAPFTHLLISEGHHDAQITGLIEALKSKPAFRSLSITRLPNKHAVPTLSNADSVAA